MQRLLKSRHRLLDLFCFALSEGEIVGNFRCVRETAARFGEDFHGAPGIFHRAEKQLGQSQIGKGMSGIDQQTLLVICLRFRERSRCLLGLVCALERSRFIVQNLGE